MLNNNKVNCHRNEVLESVIYFIYWIFYTNCILNCATPGCVWNSVSDVFCCPQVFN
jgi:hypothetical protein